MPVHEVAFELELFEWSDGHLEVAGRWRGLGGRRLARPVLTVQTDAGRRKRVVAMPGGQLGTGEGGAWHAAFNWPGDPAEIIGAELELGRNVVVDLPLPDRKRRRRRRTTSSFEVQAPDEALKAEVTALRGQVERLRSELAGRERETMRLQAELDAARGDSGDEPARPDDQQTVAIEQLGAERDAARAELAAQEERSGAEQARLADEVEKLRDELEEVSVRHARERERWQDELDELREAFADAAAEAEQTRDRHTAEIEAIRAEAVHAAAAERRSHHRRGRSADPDATVEDPAATPAGAVAAESDPDATVADPAATPAGSDTTATESRGDAPTDSRGDATVADPTEPHERLVEALPPVADAPGPLRAGSHPSLPPMTEEAPLVEAPVRTETPMNGSAEQAPRRFTPPDLHALRERLTALMPSQREPGEPETEPDEDAVEPIHPVRSAAPARARAGASFAARRSSAEVWMTRIIALVVVAVLLIAFLLLLASLG